MIISDLNYLESVETSAVVGGTYTFYESDMVDINFDTTNSFELNIDSPCLSDGNYASAGAKGVADAGFFYFGSPLNSFTKADTLEVVTYGGDSFSDSTSVAAISKQ